MPVKAPSRTFALVALVVYLAGTLLLPVLHRLHHERHGDDHVHTPAGTIYRSAGLADDDDDDDDDHDDHHDHHHDGHHDHHPAHHSHDPGHGLFALEHLAASLLSVAPFVLPPPSRLVEALQLCGRPQAHMAAPRRSHQSRGPPALFA